MRQKFEKPQKGNPHELPVMQHVWPLESIARFADGNGVVCIFDKARNKLRQAKPDDDVFCAKRVWDRRAECGYMKGIEDAFQELASEIMGMNLAPLDLLPGVITYLAIKTAPFSAAFSVWLSMTAAVGLASRPSCSRKVTCSSSQMASHTPSFWNLRKIL